jgi:hypothetical protein
MRRVLALLLLGCAGGQTGEITELSECERVVERLPIADLPEETGQLLASATARHEAELTWSDDGETTQVEIETELESDTADRIGPGMCAPIVRVPANVHVATRDERLDVAVGALIDLADEVVTIQGGAAVTSLNGRDPPGEVVEVWLFMELTDGERTFALSFDGNPAASF